jgi:hypothetical protein
MSRTSGAVMFAVIMLAFSGSAFADADSMEAALGDAESTIDQMKETHQEALGKLDEARKSGDAGMITCVNEAFTAIKGVLRHAEQNYLSLQEAFATGNETSFNEITLKISVAGGRMQELKGQLLSCGGPGTDSSVDGTTEVETESDEDQPTFNEEQALNDLIGDYEDEGTQDTEDQIESTESEQVVDPVLSTGYW